MDISPFSFFTYKDTPAWEDFLLVNGLAHDNYNTALELLGKQPVNYPLYEKADTENGTFDWLQTHYLMHLNLAATLGIPDLPDLSDVEIHSDDEFFNWLQLHMQQHQIIDAVLNL